MEHIQRADRQQYIEGCAIMNIRATSYEAFFLRSAQRFFIANDNRLRPSGVRPLPRPSPVGADGRGAATLVFFTIRCEVVPSSSAMARPSRSLSCFKSATILSRSKLCSFL